MRELFLIRHGPTHSKAMIGWTDLPADVSDHKTISWLRDHLPQDAPIVSSDLTRTRQTADALDHAGRRLPHDPGLRELHFGAWENQKFSDLDATAQAQLKDFYENPGDISTPGGESWNAFYARIHDRFDAYCGHECLICVVHFGVIVAAVQRALGITAYQAFAHKIDNLSLTKISIDRDWRLDFVNTLPDKA